VIEIATRDGWNPRSSSLNVSWPLTWASLTTDKPSLESETGPWTTRPVPGAREIGQTTHHYEHTYFLVWYNWVGILCMLIFFFSCRLRTLSKADIIFRPFCPTLSQAKDCAETGKSAPFLYTQISHSCTWINNTINTTNSNRIVSLLG